MSLCLISIHSSWLLVSAWGMGLGSRMQLLSAAMLIHISFYVYILSWVDCLLTLWLNRICLCCVWYMASKCSSLLLFLKWCSVLRCSWKQNYLPCIRMMDRACFAPCQVWPTVKLCKGFTVGIACPRHRARQTQCTKRCWSAGRSSRRKDQPFSPCLSSLMSTNSSSACCSLPDGGVLSAFGSQLCCPCCFNSFTASMVALFFACLHRQWSSPLDSSFKTFPYIFISQLITQNKLIDWLIYWLLFTYWQPALS